MRKLKTFLIDSHVIKILVHLSLMQHSQKKGSYKKVYPTLQSLAVC